MGVRVLHVYCDYKWTGPSGPVARLAAALAERGWPGALACSRAPEPQKARLARKARALGVEVDDSLRLSSSLNPMTNLAERRRLREMIYEGGYGLVHCHGSWDNLLAAWALGRGRSIPLVRTDHRGREYRANPAHKWYYGPRMSDHLIVISDRYRMMALDRLRRSPETVTTIRGAVDATQYAVREAPEGTRQNYGLAPEDFVIGIVARVQPYRRWDLLIDAAEFARKRNARVKIVVLGRGAHKERLLDEPVARRGLEDTVYPLGYLNEGYEDALRMFDAGMLLVPGSDGTCRAAMEMAVLAKPMLVAERAVLPEIVQDGRTGFVVRHDVEELADAMVRLAEMPPEQAAAWGRAGRERMMQWFSPERQVEKVIQVYEHALGG